MGQNLKLNLLGVENDTLKLDIDPKSHYAWTGGAQKILDKGRVSKYNKNLAILEQRNNLICLKLHLCQKLQLFGL